VEVLVNAWPALTGVDPKRLLIMGHSAAPAPGWPRASPGDLWSFRRRQVGRGRPDLLPGGGEAGG
jgi:hypothetical protein